VRPIEVFNSPIPGWMGAGATVLWPFVLYKRPKDQVSARLRNHEAIHIDQIRRRTVVLFYVSYVMMYLANRIAGYGHYEAYRKIHWEIEAFNNDQNLNYLKKSYRSFGPQVKEKDLKKVWLPI